MDYNRPLPRLRGEIAALTVRVRAARIIAHALVAAQQKERNMTPKLQGLHDKLRDVAARVEGRAEALIARLDRADAASAAADAAAHAEIDKIETAVRQVEGVIAKLTNSGPPLSNGSTS